MTSPFAPPLPLVVPGGMEATDFVGWAGSGSGSTCPRPRHGYSNSSLNRSTTTAPTLGHGHSSSSVNHSTTNRHARSSFGTTTTSSTATLPLPLARVRTHSVSATTGAGHGYGYGYGYGYALTDDDGHSVFSDSPFESESPLHWQDEPALAEAESRPTSMDAAPVHGYGVGSGSGNANDGRASSVYGVEYAGRGVRRCTTLI
jgi:hypothetical protein